MASAAASRRSRLGIDLGGTKIEGVVLDAERRIVVRQRIPTEQEGGYEHILDRVAALVAELRRHAPDLESVGIGTPGSASALDGTMKNSNTACLNGKQLPVDLATRLGLPVVVENDANCFALAEALAGSGRGYDLVFGVILGTGVGGGIVFRGAIWSGPQHIAGEWGHHSIDPNGPRCYCGQRGCVETLLSGPALERAYREALEASGKPVPDGHSRASDVADRAAAGDPIAGRAIDGWVEHFGRALANLVSILDPSIVVLGGGLSNLDVACTRGRDAVARYVFNDELRTPIVKHSLGDSAGVIGAALLAGR